MKKIILIIISCAIILIGAGTITTILIKNDTNKSSDNPTEEIEEKESKKDYVNGEYSNIENTLRKQHIYKNYRISDLLVSKQEIFYVVSFQIENIGSTAEEHKHFDFTFLSNSKKVLGIVECEIPELLPNKKETIYCQSVNKKIFEAFDYKISKASTAKIGEQ